MREADPSVAESICHDLDASPTPYHAVARVVQQLETSGFRPFATDAAPTGKWYYRQGGAIVAWVVGPQHHSSSPLRIVGAHTDSPNLRIKPRPDRTAAGFAQLGVEVYGGALTNSWLDRDLGLAGRVSVRTADGLETRLIRDDRPLVRVPQLAIHLDGDYRQSGLKLNNQTHMAPIWGMSDSPDFVDYLSEQLALDGADVLSWDIMLHDLNQATLTGLGEVFLSSARIDNQLSCFVATRALAAVADELGDAVPVMVLFDHEEVGSVSTTGAASSFLSHQLERIWASLEADLENRMVSRNKSLLISADGAHATHPNYADRHEPEHHVALNGGPVIKINANQRYATDSVSAAVFEQACRDAEVPVQHFVSRTDLACGSTIGPAAASQLGIAVVDAGMAQLAMHSVRETAGAYDPAWFAAALTNALRG